MASDISDIPASLRAARRLANLSQQALASRQHLPQSQISRAERGEDVRLSTLRQLARGLGLEVILLPVASIAAVAALLHGATEEDAGPRFAASAERDPE